MGCSTCKKKGKKEKGVNYDEYNPAKEKAVFDSLPNEIEIIPKNIIDGFSGNFLLKFVTFLGIIVIFPLIYLVIIYIMFTNFFLPKKAPKDLFGDSIQSMAERYARFRIKRIAKKRERQFEKNREYKGDSELSNIEVFTTTENNEDDDK